MMGSRAAAAAGLEQRKILWYGVMVGVFIMFINLRTEILVDGNATSLLPSSSRSPVAMTTVYPHQPARFLSYGGLLA